MRVLERTFTSLRDNLDFDDSLLEEAERRGAAYLRFWEARSHGIVLGRSSRDLKRELGAEYEREVVHRDDLVLL